jgi:hypothetical protein
MRLTYTRVYLWYTQHNTVSSTLWKSSNCTLATAPRTLDAIALHASPTKSGTLNSLAESSSLVLSLMWKCLGYNSTHIAFEHYTNRVGLSFKRLEHFHCNMRYCIKYNQFSPQPFVK